MIKHLFLFCLLAFSFASQAQQSPASIEELKQQVLSLNERMDQVQLNLSTSEKKFKRWILVATFGYSLTITGGLMLGRSNDQLGQVLLITGGATGAVGTVLMIDSFKYLGRAGRRR
ncbi:MAG: hypothetical protein ACK55U_09120 [Bacteroidota bacterium]